MKGKIVSTKLRYIKPSSIQMGDSIRVSGVWMDTQTSVVGTFAKRDHTANSTYYLTEQGAELLAAHRDGSVTRGEARVNKITLLNRNPDPTLFDL